MVRRARSIVYWPNINTDIRKMEAECVTCQELKPKSTKTPLYNMMTDIYNGIRNKIKDPV